MLEISTFINQVKNIFGFHHQSKRMGEGRTRQFGISLIELQRVIIVVSLQPTSVTWRPATRLSGIYDHSPGSKWCTGNHQITQLIYVCFILMIPSAPSPSTSMWADKHTLPLSCSRAFSELFMVLLFIATHKHCHCWETADSCAADTGYSDEVIRSHFPHQCWQTHWSSNSQAQSEGSYHIISTLVSCTQVTKRSPHSWGMDIFAPSCPLYVKKQMIFPDSGLQWMWCTPTYVFCTALSEFASL